MSSVLHHETGNAETAYMLEPGTRIEVRRRFDQSWARGFEVAEVLDGAYRIRRLSDGEVLPTEFTEDDVRAERRRKQGLWWY